MTNKTSAQNRWPRHMPYLTSKSFVHEAWARMEDGSVLAVEEDQQYYTHAPYIDEVSPNVVRRMEEVRGCGTRFCLVGWARHAFGLPADPYEGPQLPSKGEEFLRQLCKNMGRPIGGAEPQRASHPVGRKELSAVEALASDAFEGDGPFDALDPITEQQAARAWNRTLRDFGYTEDA